MGAETGFTSSTLVYYYDPCSQSQKDLLLNMSSPTRLYTLNSITIHKRSPSLSRRCSNWSLASAFVKMSANISFVGQYMSLTIPSATASLT